MQKLIFLSLSILLVFQYSYGQSTTENQDKMLLYEALMHSVKIGNPAPDFSYLDIKKDSVRLSSFIGKPVVLFIMDGMCPFALSQVSAYEKLKNKFRWDNIVFMTITTGIPKRDWMNYVKKNKLTDIQLWSGGFTEQPAYNYLLKDLETWKTIDPASVETAAFQKAIKSGISIIPVSYVFAVLGSDGEIVDNYIPRISDNNLLEERIKDLLDQAKP